MKLSATLPCIVLAVGASVAAFAQQTSSAPESGQSKLKASTRDDKPDASLSSAATPESATPGAAPVDGSKDDADPAKPAKPVAGGAPGAAAAPSQIPKPPTTSLDALFKLVPEGKTHEVVAYPVMENGVMASFIQSERMTRLDDNCLRFENAVIDQKGEKPMTFRLVSAVYNRSTDQLMSTQHSVIENADYTIEGDTMNYDRKSTTSRMTNIRMTIFNMQGLGGDPAAAGKSQDAKEPAATDSPDPKAPAEKGKPDPTPAPAKPVK
jgi:hypothetical protein